MTRTIVAALLLSVAAICVGCTLGRDSGDDGSGGADRLESGEALGAIERLPGGTPVATDVRTLLSARCEAGVLSLRTNREEITSPMDCGQMLPEGIFERFVGKPVAIRAQDGRLIVENATEGTLDFPAAEPQVTEIAGAP